MFKTDKQTLTDLNALDWNSASLCGFFDQTLTLGGRDELYGFFLQPLADATAIVQRQEAIAYLAGQDDIDRLFDKYMMADLERYLGTSQEFYSESRVVFYLNKLSSNFLSLSYKKDRLFIRQSVREITALLLALHALLARAAAAENPTGLLLSFAHTFDALIAGIDPEELRLLAEGRHTLGLILKYDHLFRSPKKSALQEIFRMVYTLDALRSVAKRLGGGLIFPKVSDHAPTAELLRIDGMYNLAIKDPVRNDVVLTQDKNIWFLTGANMTGKSSLLKGIGSCVLLAHLGFPVPARAMTTPIFHGLFTSINLSDNIDAGYSHFFAEVHRLKAMGGHVADGGRMVIMLDELFKGTNYQDAHEATLQLIESISGIAHSLFFISTHITELGATLQSNKRVALKHLETTTHPEQGVRFSYRLLDGVASEKLGMWFLRREGVFETFRGPHKK